MAISYSFVPSADGAFLTWCLVLDEALTASSTSLGMTTLQATTYHAAYEAFAAAMAVINNPATRTKGAIRNKDVSKKSLRALSQAYGKMIQVNPAISDQTKLNVGIPTRAQPTPIPVPTAIPVVDFVSVLGNRVRIKLTSNEGSKRGKPVGCAGASIFSATGPVAPTTTAGFHFEGNTTKNLVDIEFDEALPPGTRVWVVAFYFNGKMQSGTTCAPVGTFLQGGFVQMAA